MQVVNRPDSEQHYFARINNNVNLLLMEEKENEDILQNKIRKNFKLSPLNWLVYTKRGDKKCVLHCSLLRVLKVMGLTTDVWPGLNHKDLHG